MACYFISSPRPLKGLHKCKKYIEYEKREREREREREISLLIQIYLFVYCLFTSLFS